METEQTQADSVETRLNSFFSPEGPAEETVEAPAGQVQSQEDGQSTEQEQTSEDDSELLEIDGNEYKIPRDLKSKVDEWRQAHLRTEDYTRKTKDAAELMRVAQAQQEALEHREKFEASIKNERRELDHIESQLDQFGKIDFRLLDADQRINLLMEQTALERKRDQLRGMLNEKRQAFDNESMQSRAKLYESGQKYLQQSIANWGPKAIEEVVSTAKDVGFTDSELAGITDPRQIRLAWEAAQYRKFQAEKSKALTAVQKAPPVVKPGAVTNQAQNNDKALRAKLKSTGKVEHAYALLAKHLKV